MDKSEKPAPRDVPKHLIPAYERMLDKVRAAVHEIKADSGSALQHAVDKAKEEIVGFEELTREEAQRVAEYVTRDIHDLATHVVNQEQELGDWLHMDLTLVETRLKDVLLALADRTTLELALFKEEAARLGEWHTGEVTGNGSMQCTKCGEVLRFKKISHIPPCPKCYGTVFHPVFD